MTEGGRKKETLIKGGDERRRAQREGLSAGG